MTFQEKIVRLRKIGGLTQDEFASAVGVSRQAVYKWESGQSYPEVPKLLEIKKLFMISIDDLLDEEYEVALPEKKKRKRLSKEMMAQVEAETLGISAVTEPVGEAAISDPVETAPIEVSEEPVFETATAPAAPAIDETPKEEEPTVSKEVEEETTSETLSPIDDDSDLDDVDSKKKVGFFGRLFGRK